jgi:hypothetical protein
VAFKGLFIGIDRYASTEINWLSCASPDAIALHALFTDTLGGETKLLTDEQATVAAIGEQFGQLAACSPDDVVVIAFSGQGTETHELVGHDTDPYDLAGTTIPLTMLGEWSRIPSRRLLIVLDCCFSGGMGAKALHVEGVLRDIQSVWSPTVAPFKASSLFGEHEEIVVLDVYRHEQKDKLPTEPSHNHTSICKPSGSYTKPLEFVPSALHGK